jgi:hypothetical protein
MQNQAIVSQGARVVKTNQGRGRGSAEWRTVVGVREGLMGKVTETSQILEGKHRGNA